MDKTQPAQKYLACIRALTDQCAALIWEQDELQKQVWRYEKNGVTCQTYGHKIDSSCSECNVHENYTAPPKREWVGLTSEETSGFTSQEMTVVKYVSKVLQEKNNGT